MLRRLRRGRFGAPVVLLILLPALVGALRPGRASDGIVGPLPVGNTRAAAFPGLQNVCHLAEKLYSGSAPEGDAGFESLQKLGVKTVLSGDGARPDVERARKHGVRYVERPFGYDGCAGSTA